MEPSNRPFKISLLFLTQLFTAMLILVVAVASHTVDRKLVRSDPNTNQTLIHP